MQTTRNESVNPITTFLPLYPQFGILTLRALEGGTVPRLWTISTGSFGLSVLNANLPVWESRLPWSSTGSSSRYAFSWMPSRSFLLPASLNFSAGTHSKASHLLVHVHESEGQLCSRIAQLIGVVFSWLHRSRIWILISGFHHWSCF